MIRQFFLGLFVFLLIDSGCLKAQGIKNSPEDQKFSLGVKAGPSVTFGVYPDKELRDQFKTRPKLGAGGAFFINFPLKNG
jgi:hypothetical protein